MQTESARTPAQEPNPRLVETVDGLVAVIRDFIREKKITPDEFHRAIHFLMQCGESRREIPLLLDLFLEMTVVDANDVEDGATPSCVLGPYYADGAPVLEPPYVLPQRRDEPGDPLIFSGSMRSLDGKPLPGVVLDLWQAGADGTYSQFVKDAPPDNLRGKFATDAEGRFELETIMPMPYQIPDDGPVGSLLRALGRHSWRPAHLHLKISHPGYEPLTTQIYTSTSPWLDSDCVGAVKDSLIATCERHDDPKEIEKAGFAKPFYTLHWDFVLRPAR